MKKFLIVFASLFLVGCGNKLTCTAVVDEEEYTTKEKIVYEYDKKGKILNASVNYIMTFETEEKAKSYMNLFKSLDNEINIELDGKEITLSSTEDYSESDTDKDTLKTELEKDGYVCK